MKRFLSTVVLVFLVACGSQTQVPEVDNGYYDYSGLWNLQLVDTEGGPATGTLTLSQQGLSVKGTWQVTFAGFPPEGGTLIGSAGQRSVQLRLFFSVTTACNIDMTLVAVADGSSLEGSYAGFNCGETSISGTVTATRR